MEAVEFLFPLLTLPEKALKYVIQQMTVIDQFSYSLISPPTKGHVVDHGHVHESELVLIIDRITLNFGTCHFKFFEGQLDQISLDSELPIPETIHVESRDDNLTSVIPNFKNWTFKQFVEHFTQIYHWKSASLVFIMPTSKHPIEPLYDAFSRLEVDSVTIGTRVNEALLMRFLPKTKICSINSSNPFTQGTLQKILIQNFEYLLTAQIHNLDDMFLINSCHVETCSEFKEKELNMFLRSWKMGSNPRLKYLKLGVSSVREDPFNKEMVFDGTNGQKATHDDLMRINRYIERLERDNPLRNLAQSGYVLRRVDGRKATASIVWSGRQNCWSLRMSVWDTDT